MDNSNNGYLLNNRYRLIDQIGEGGMANVYLAKDTILERNVAIKVLRGDLSHDETFVKRFQREALAATTLEHPNIVQVFDVGEEQGYHYIVMEYVEGKTLKQLIKQHGPLSVGEVIDVMEQLVSAVEHAHSRHVIHRDIKPQNVMVRSDGEVKLTDFGIAIAQNSAQLTQTNSIMGSVHYLAPELAKGQQASVQSDIYALGIVMFELLTGTIPFAGDSAVNIALMHMEEKIPSVREIVGSDVSQAVENIVLKATAKNKNYRYQSAHDMLIDLVDCQYKENEPVFNVEDDQVEEPSETIIMDRNEIDKQLKPNKTRMSNKKKGIIAAIIAAVAVLGVVLFLIFGPNSNMTDIKMPDLIDKTEQVATEELTALKVTEDEGFTINVEKEYSSDIAEGNVISTNPVAETQLEKDAKIVLKISSGQKPIAVESVVGLMQDAATSKLQAQGFKVNVETQESDQPQYTVLSMNPTASTELVPGSSVTIVVATEAKVTVINVSGFSYSTAYSKLQELGLLVTTNNCTEDAVVKSQNKAAGDSVKKGTTVKLTCEVQEPTTPSEPNTDNSNDGTTVPDAEAEDNTSTNE
ncbi:Stk1 family PASTA domain-containing Ser/Thr kinase [Mycoplasma sp. P36-A1]|uniref:Stk1 family PASTA domain-containing Ser/Thr kinase n=1 Tax=Mycoplasma sp. P36-A1 TaxID=3252900 RepID=UPI003C2BFBA0